MNSSEIPIPTREEIIQKNAYEARMHFLKPDKQFGTYQTLPGMVSEPIAAAVEELPYRQHSGMLLWVDFEKTDVIGMKGRLPLTTTRRVGEIVIASEPFTYTPYSELLEPSDSDAFIRLWLGYFAMDRTKDSFGNRRHPLGPVHSLYKRLNISGKLAEVEARAQVEQWDPKFDARKALVAILLREFLESKSYSDTAKTQTYSFMGSSTDGQDDENVA